MASVQVDFNTAEFPDSPDTFQNDGVGSRDRKSNQDSNSLTDILIGIPLNDEKKPNGESSFNRNGIIFPQRSSTAFSALEIGLYVLMMAFCVAIVLFVISCFVYASKHKMIQFENNKERPVVGMTVGNATPAPGHFPILREPRKHRESTTNAHNWVWLGRSTMDRSSMIRENPEHFGNPRGKLHFCS